MNSLMKEALEGAKKFNLMVEAILAIPFIILGRGIKVIFNSGKAAFGFAKKHIKAIMALIILLLIVLVIYMALNPKKEVEKVTEYIYVDAEDNTEEENTEASLEAEEMTARI